MKKILLPALISLLIVSCSDSADKNSNDSTAKDSATIQNDSLINSDTFMPKDSVPIIPSDTASNGNSGDNINNDGRKSKYPLISGTLYYNRNYCGGARPSPEILETYEKYLPLGNSEIKLKNRTETFYASTDQSGNFSSSIAYGTFDVYVISVMPRIVDINPQSCSACFNKPVGKVTISNKKKNDIKITFPCSDDSKLRP